MNSQHKIIAILLLTAAIVLGGGYYFWHLSTARSPFGLMLTEQYPPGAQTVTPGVDLSNINGEATKRGKARRTKSRLHNATSVAATSPQASLMGQTEITPSTRPVARATNRAAIPGKAAAQPYSGSMIALASADNNAAPGRTSGNGNATESNTNLSLGGIINPMAAPQTPGGSVLIDPTPDNEMQKIPVGNGLWLMIALGIGYAKRGKRARTHQQQ